MPGWPDHPGGCAVNPRWTMVETRPENEGGERAALREKAAYASGYANGLVDGGRSWRAVALSLTACIIAAVIAGFAVIGARLPWP